MTQTNQEAVENLKLAIQSCIDALKEDLEPHVKADLQRGIGDMRDEIRRLS